MFDYPRLYVAGPINFRGWRGKQEIFPQDPRLFLEPSGPEAGAGKVDPHRIHGAAIYGNMDPINIPPLC